MCKKIFLLIFSVVLVFNCSYAKENELSCKSALLMDFSTGKVLYKQNPHERMAPASVTKVMTLLLIMEEIENGNISYNDIVTASEYAKSMGGSTIFLDTGEQMTVDDLIKGIAVSSGNDACVAMAEYISGTTEAFVERMNNRAKELGMTNTNFVNCNGLDAENHYSTAYDIALMSRELMKHNDIFRYTTIWMDSLRNGNFTLSNTNKLVRFYEGTTGLKTGSTSKAGFCISATAKRDNLHLIAVIMNAPTSKERQADASSLLNYGFNTFGSQKAVKKDSYVSDVKINKGLRDFVQVKYKDDIDVLYEKSSSAEPEVSLKIKQSLDAPVIKGDVVGEAVCYIDGAEVGKTDIVACENVGKLNFTCAYKEIFDMWIGNK